MRHLQAKQDNSISFSSRKIDNSINWFPPGGKVFESEPVKKNKKTRH